MATAKTMPNLDLFELILDETVEVCQELERLRSKLRRCKKGSEAYFDVMADIDVANAMMKAKTKSLLREREKIVDAMPD